MVEIVFLVIVAVGAVLGLRIPFEQPRIGLVLAIGMLGAAAIAVVTYTPSDLHTSASLKLALQLDMTMPIALAVAGYATLWLPIAAVRLLGERGDHSRRSKSPLTSTMSGPSSGAIGPVRSNSSST